MGIRTDFEAEKIKAASTYIRLNGQGWLEMWPTLEQRLAARLEESNGSMRSPRDCPVCNGSGESYPSYAACRTCGGWGYLP